MEFIVGILLALAVSVFASLVGLDKERAFYPTALIVIAALYGLFAVMGGSMKTLAAEAAPMIVFITLATVGFRKNAWLVVVGLVAHAVFDFFHPHLIHNAGVPPLVARFLPRLRLHRRRLPGGPAPAKEKIR